MIGPWLRLLRIGNGFSPIADVAAGAAITGATVLSPLFARTALASLCLYFAGMVLCFAPYTGLVMLLDVAQRQ